MRVLMGEILPNQLSEADLAALQRAVRSLERESLAMRLATLLRKPIGHFDRLVPATVGNAASQVSEAALRLTLRLTLRSRFSVWRDHSGRWHKTLATLAGATGGAFGLPALAVELPISTGLLLHAIAEIARAEGEDLSKPEATLACLEVFALGETSSHGKVGDIGYHAIRAALARSVASLSRYAVERGFAEQSAPIFARAISQIAERFGIMVSQKLAAQAVPVLGAVSGAAINAAFMSHFQSKARGHFVIRRLERIYGRDLITAAYAEMKFAEGL